MLEIFPRALPFREAPEFLAGGGEMGERMRAFQWTRTPLGPADDWPESLRHAVRMMLQSRQPMSLWWGDGLTHLYNDACRAILGPSHPSALGMAAQVVWGEHWELLAPRADAALRRHEGGSVAPLRMLVERQGCASECYFTMTCHAVRGDQGHFGGALWSFSDVTRSVVRERELALLDRLRDALAQAGGLRRLCARACAALAGDAEDFPFAALYAIDDRAKDARLVASAGVSNGSEVAPEALMLGDACPWPFDAVLAGDGMQRARLDDPRFGRLPQGPWDRAPREAIVMRLAAPSEEASGLALVLALNPYRALDESFSRFVGLVGDAIAARIETGRLRAHAAALERSEAELRALDRRKDEFLATLAHELRNPLAPLRNGLEVVRLANGDAAKIDKARGMMQRQLQQMVRLVDDLLDVSRVSRGKLELRLADVELAAVLRTAMEASQPLLGERGHSLMARIPPERIVMRGDAARLAQVFCNLLNNAAKYTEPGGRIELDAAFVEDRIVVRVKDNGIGIPPEMHERVFEVFTQVDRSLERSQGGLGIGLSIARRLVEMHGGDIAVESEGLGRGTEFTVRLPARIEAAAGVIEREAHRPAPLGKRILVADDNPDSVETLQIMLEVMGNQVRIARDGEEAVQVAAEFRPDAILMDIGMPKLNGYDACARIRSGGCTAFIVALTGWSQEEDRARSRQAGFDRHLVKPVEPRALESLIRSIQ